MKTPAFCHALAAAALLGALAGARAATINVTNLNDSGSGSLRHAIASANSGDTIQVFLIGTINLASGLTIDKSLNIYGAPGGRFTAITRASGAPNFRILTVTAGTIDFRSMTISNGRCSNSEPGGAGIYVAAGATFSLTYATVSGNDANGNGGGGVFNAGFIHLFDCTLTDNQGVTGGAVYNDGFATLDNCTIANNTATTTASGTGGGAGIFSDGGITVRNSTITGNSATTNATSLGGGGMRNFGGNFSVANTVVANNTSNQLGPDVLGGFISGGYNFIRMTDNSTGFGNTGDQLGTSGAPKNPDLGALKDNGGPVDTKAPNSGSPLIDQGKVLGAANDARTRSRPYDNPNISNAVGGDGADIGAVEVQAPTVVTNNNDSGPGSLREAVTKPKVQSGDTITFAPNVTGTIDLTSGELSPQESITINGPGQTVLRVARSSAPGTAAFRVFNISQFIAVTISGLDIANGNPSSASGGGGILTSGTLVVRDCTIEDNFAMGGAGISNTGGTLTVTRCSFARNNSNGFPGGGLLSSLGGNPVTVTITGSTFFGNVGGDGGAIYNETNMSLTNCTLSGNTANPAGGGIRNNMGNLTLLNCTVSNNTVNTTVASAGGGGIANLTGGIVHIGNTIVAGNTHNQGGRDVFGAFVSDGYNLIRVKEDSTGFTDGVSHDLVGTAASPRNAFLGSLQNNFGTTLTLSLGSSSPAINAGHDATAPKEDQRGYSRNGVSDIGAFESDGVPPPPPFLTAGVTNITDTSATLNVTVNPSGSSTSVQITSDFGFSTTQDAGAGTADIPFAINVSGLSPSTQYHFSVTATNAGGMTQTSPQRAFTTLPPPPTPTPTATPAGFVANVSTRLPVGTNENVLIEGFIVEGPPGSTKKIIVRAIGPSLVPFGIPDALVNPTLEIHDASNLIAMNNDWKVTQTGGLIVGDQFGEITASGFAPSNDQESAIIADLAPGSYTAVVQGAGGTTGTGVVDAYDLSTSSPARLGNIATRGLVQPGDKLMIAGFIVQNGPARIVVIALGPSLLAFGINNALPDTTLELHNQNGVLLLQNDNWKSDPQQEQELESVGLHPSHDLEAALVTTLQPGQYTAQVRNTPETTGIGVVQVFFLQ
jgi:hypothetical protein